MRAPIAVTCQSPSLLCRSLLSRHSPSKQLQAIFWALPGHKAPSGDPGAPLILQLSIYQHAAAYKALTSTCRVNSSLLPTLCSFVGSSFHGAAPIFNISSFSFWGQLFGRGIFFFKPYVWIKSGTAAFWALEKTNAIIIRQSPPSSLLSLAAWTNVTLKQWKCCHISLQSQDFSISSYAIDDDSQSTLFPLDSTWNKGAQPFAGKTSCHSVTYFLNSSPSTVAALWLSWLFVPMQKSCPTLKEFAKANYWQQHVWQ